MNIPIKWITEYVDIPDMKVFTDKMSMIGHMLDKTKITDTDTVIDLELRGNRADCYAVLGIAREAHASFGGRFDVPKPSHELPSHAYSDFEVIPESDVVHRFYSVIIKNVKVGPSPDWMQERLKNYGVDPINNIVDITNYVMIETGMPLHAFDLNKMGGKKLILRAAKEGEKYVTFDDTTLTLTPEDVVFASENDEVMGLVGILGGKNSGIHEDTTDILLECAAYDRVSIRKSMFRHKAQTEAGLRHSHDLHASYCDYTLQRAASLVMEFANGGSTEMIGINDYYPNQDTPKVIEFNPSEVTRLGGVEVPVNEQKEILERLEFGVEEKDGKLIVTAPLFRTDIFASEDIVEEVLRIWGYEKIPSKTLSSVIPNPITQPEVLLEEASRDVLQAQGLDEIITVPFIHEPLFDKVHDPLKGRAISLVNPPTSQHTHMRTSMFIEHLDVAHKILARGEEELAIFEIGKIYLKKDGEVHQPPHKPEFPYVEERRLTAIFSSKRGHWDYYHVKGVMENYMDRLGIQNVTFNKTTAFPYSTAAEMKQGDLVLGTIGIVNPAIAKGVFNINQEIVGFEINIENLTKSEKTPMDFMPYSMYPSIVMDMSVVLPEKTQSGDVLEAVKSVGGPLIRSVSIQDVFDMKDGKRSILFSIQYQSKEKTLTTDEVNELHTKIGEELVTKFHVTIRGK